MGQFKDICDHLGGILRTSVAEGFKDVTADIKTNKDNITRNTTDITALTQRIHDLEVFYANRPQTLVPIPAGPTAVPEFTETPAPTRTSGPMRTLRNRGICVNNAPILRNRVAYEVDRTAPVVSNEIAARLGFPGAKASDAVKAKVIAFLRCTWQTLPGTSTFLRKGSKGAWALKEDGWGQFLADLRKVHHFQEQEGRLVIGKV